jgi:meiosis-specific transcription factor NDT80
MFYSAVPSRSYAIGPNSITSSSPVLAATARESYTNSAQSFNRSIDYRSPHDLSKPFPSNRPAYNPPNTMSYAHLSPGYPTPSSYPTDYRSEPGEASLPFNEEQITTDLVSQDGVNIQPEISCKIEKGFFYSQEHAWTCYRRNYFSVSCSYSLEPHVDCGAIYIKRKNENTNATEMKQIQALAVNLGASVDGSNGKIVELVQHTPKRDKGPQLRVAHTKLCPCHKGPSHTTPGAIGPFPTSYSYHTAANTLGNSPHLPLQHLTTQTRETQEAQAAGISFPTPTATAHTFERIQFKNATANNGKRRAQQQYYHLIVELFADIRTDPSAPEEWVKVAQRVSQQVVVRGRSPSHYKNEGPTSNNRTGTSTSLNGRQNAWSPFQGHTNQVYVPNGRMLPGPGNGNHYIYPAMQPIGEPNAPMGHHMLNTSAMTGLEPSRALPTNLSNGRSIFASSAAPGATDEESSGYSYYPQPLYEAGLAPTNSSMIKSDDMTHSGKSSSSPESAAGTFSQPVTAKYTSYGTSKGYYPS